MYYLKKERNVVDQLNMFYVIKINLLFIFYPLRTVITKITGMSYLFILTKFLNNLSSKFYAENVI